MFIATASTGGTTVEVFVVKRSGVRGAAAANPVRYAVAVIPMDAGEGQWWPHVRIADGAGNIVRDAGSTAVRFPTRAAAEHAGWSFVEAWIRCREIV